MYHNQFNTFTVSNDQWNTQEDTSKSMRNDTSKSMRNDTAVDTSLSRNSKKIKHVALEGISQAITSVSRKLC